MSFKEFEDLFLDNPIMNEYIKNFVGEKIKDFNVVDYYGEKHELKEKK